MAIPERPVGLSSDENRLWDELIDQIPLEVLKRSDGRLLRELCTVLASRNRIAQILHEDMMRPQVMEIFLALVAVEAEFSPIFGLTPVDRARMRIVDEPDDFSDWMEGSE